MTQNETSELLPALIVKGLFVALLAAGLLAVVSERSVEPDSDAALELALALSATPPSPLTVIPDFSLVQTIDARKRIFLNYIQNYVDEQNLLIARDRSRLRAIVASLREGAALNWEQTAELNAESRDWLLELSKRYRLAQADFDQPQAWLDELLRRVDFIPTSLVLAQAANESAWGTSRFVREGNNLFGQWCFDPGCGIVPQQRRSGASHEVRQFATLRDAVRSYFFNLNTNFSYHPFRELRQEMRAQGRKLDSMVLAFGLNRYSERGRSYVDELQIMIVQNDLAARDADFVAANSQLIRVWSD